MKLSLADRIVLSAVNAGSYLRHPRLALYFRRRLGHWGNFAAPLQLSELMQWRKVFDHNPAFVTFCNKHATKAWVAERVPDIASPPTEWIGTRPEDIPDSLLAPGHVIKVNSATSLNYFPHREHLPRKAAERRLRRWLDFHPRDWWRRSRLGEWAYRPNRPLLMVEPLLAEAVVDIGVRAFNGEVSFVSVATAYKTGQDRIAFFWPDGSRLPASDFAEVALPPDYTVPQIAEAVSLARRLSRGFDYLRIDFLVAEGRLWMGEITVYPASGLGGSNDRAELTYRQWLGTLETSWVLSRKHGSPFLRLYLAAFRRWLAERRKELDVVSPSPSPAPPAPGR